MQFQLTIIALSLWLIVILGLTCVIFALVSMWKEARFGWPLSGVIWFTVVMACLIAMVLFADSLEKVRSLEIISRRVEAMILGF